MMEGGQVEAQGSDCRVSEGASLVTMSASFLGWDACYVLRFTGCFTPSWFGSCHHNTQQAHHAFLMLMKHTWDRFQCFASRCAVAV